MELTKHQPHFLQILNVFYDYVFKVTSLTDFLIRFFSYPLNKLIILMSLLIKEVSETDRIPVAADVTVTFW